MPCALCVASSAALSKMICKRTASAVPQRRLQLVALAAEVRRLDLSKCIEQCIEKGDSHDSNST
jgi:hypothetical protein